MAAGVPTDAVEALPAAGHGRGERAERATPTVVIDAGTHWRRWWADLYTYRGALRSLAWRNVRSRYKQAALGAGWAVVQPMVQVAVFTVLFGTLARVPTSGVPYPLFALAALLPWNLFSKVVLDGAVSLTSNQQLITKLFFPRVYLVLAAGASALLDAVITAVLLAVLMAAYGVSPGPWVLAAVPALLGVAAVGYGLAAFLAALNARWRDVQHALPFLLQIGLLVTPVVYGNAFVPERWRWLLALNPMTALIEIFRGAMLGLPMPEPRLLFASLAVGAVAAAGGVWYFTRAERGIVDFV